MDSLLRFRVFPDQEKTTNFLIRSHKNSTLACSERQAA